MCSAISLPQPPRFDRWPVALRSAMRLRGALVDCGPGVRGVAWPDSPGVRLTSLRPWLEEGLVASYLTAAWVWAAAASPGSRLQISSRAGHRPRQASQPEVQGIEQRLAPSDTVHFGSLQVTSRQRTTLDLLHQPDRFGCAEIVACQLMLLRISGGAMTLRTHMSAHHRPHARLARSRLSAMTGSA